MRHCIILYPQTLFNVFGPYMRLLIMGLGSDDGLVQVI